MRQIIKGTTPTFKFTFDNIIADSIIAAYLTIVQDKTLVIEKSIQDASVGDGYIEWTLTQDETLMLNHISPLRVQIRYKLSDGFIGASEIKEVDVIKVLKDGEI